MPNLPDNPTERHYVQALYHLTRTLDPTRPVIGNDGWESVATDVIGVHDYDPDPDRLARRYHAEEAWPRVVRRERPGGRLLVVGQDAHTELPVVLSECGGIAFSETPAAWGYSRAATAVTLETMYRKLMMSLHSVGLFSGFCYTQFADTYQEAKSGSCTPIGVQNSLLEAIAAATRGVNPPANVQSPWQVAPVHLDDDNRQ